MMNCFLGDKRPTPANTWTFWGGEPLDLAANGRVLVAIGPEQGWQRQEAGSKHGVDFALSPEAGLIYNSPRKFQDAALWEKVAKGDDPFPFGESLLSGAMLALRSLAESTIN